jgi:hypothetical protein
VTTAWQRLEDEITRRRDASRKTVFWWRDDDAARPTPELRRLLDLAYAASVPLALAVVPESAEPGLFEIIRDEVHVLQHGADHRNRASANQKKTEFPAAESDEAALARLQRASQRLSAMSGGRALPVLAPPWNRLRGDLVAKLPQAGLSGLTLYGARATAHPAAGVTQVNTHVDIVAWRSGRGFVGEAQALAQACGVLARDDDEPIGVLTHHAEHQHDALGFLARLFERSREAGARWASPRELWPSA